MTDVLLEIRKRIERRVKDYEKADEKHMNEIMDCQERINQLLEKREVTEKLIREAEYELEKLDEYEKFIG